MILKNLRKAGKIKMEIRNYAAPEITTIQELKISGIKLEMSLTVNRTAELWKRFMNLLFSKKNIIPVKMISLQVYPENYFKEFNPDATFKKYAAVETKVFDRVPEELETFTVPASLYAVFHYKGLNTDPSIFQYIYQQWLPVSGYQLDNRPHFEILGDKYKNGDPDSEEDIYIPVKIF